jgi:hypothetical protein
MHSWNMPDVPMLISINPIGSKLWAKLAVCTTIKQINFDDGAVCTALMRCSRMNPHKAYYPKTNPSLSC